jgi:hypothetical protein
MWAAFGEQAKAELLDLPEKGRNAFREALIACSVYAADEYDSPTDRNRGRTGTTGLRTLTNRASGLIFLQRNVVRTTLSPGRSPGLPYFNGEHPANVLVTTMVANSVPSGGTARASLRLRSWVIGT